ncbi:hypothetical protein BJV74DRAFT_394746 [Russula compacta]|nr:hypothetical protein BJV74DRAFT_394746 [Russula compacta]
MPIPDRWCKTGCSMRSVPFSPSRIPNAPPLPQRPVVNSTRKLEWPSVRRFAPQCPLEPFAPSVES